MSYMYQVSTTRLLMPSHDLTFTVLLILSLISRYPSSNPGPGPHVTVDLSLFNPLKECWGWMNYDPREQEDQTTC